MAKEELIGGVLYHFVTMVIEQMG